MLHHCLKIPTPRTPVNIIIGLFLLSVIIQSITPVLYLKIATAHMLTAMILFLPLNFVFNNNNNNNNNNNYYYYYYYYYYCINYLYSMVSMTMIRVLAENILKYSNKVMIQRILHGRAKIRILSSSALTSERYFWHEVIKFVSPSSHVMFCLFYRDWWNFHIKHNFFKFIYICTK